MNEQSLKLARDKAVKASRAKSQFLANMSHEIRTPMNGVLGNADLLLEENLNNDQKKVVSTIIKSGESMMQILNDILDFSKIDAGQLTLAPHVFDLKDHLRSVSHLYQSLADEKGLSLNLDIDPTVPDQVFADSTRIRQIVSNLVSNALKFTRQGFVTIRVQVKEVASDFCTLHFEVEDSGIGIREEVVGKLFLEFTQADLSTTRKFGGTGLGLAICQKLSALLGSEIKVGSTYGKGSVFYLDLRLKRAIKKKKTQASEKSSGPKGQKFYKHLKVLLVEDNVTNQELACNFFKKFGLEFSLASNGKEAVSMAQEEHFDLIFMDCHMPVMDGYEATKIIRKLNIEFQPRIIAMTANAMAGDQEKCLLAGMDDYLAKPVSGKKITEILDRCEKKQAS